MKYILIKFEDAKLFVKNKRNKDYFFNRNDYKKRKDCENVNFIEPITVHQISNMLHVMFGERPVPSFRQCFYKRNDDIFNMANDGYIKINSPKQSYKRKEETIESYITELINTRKSSWNSWSEPSSIEWFKIKLYLDDIFDEFLKKLESVVGFNPKTKKFMDFKLLKNIEVDKEKYNILIDWLKENKKTPIINFFESDKSKLSEFKTKKMRLDVNVNLVNMGINDDVRVLDGEIIVPVNEKMLERLIRKNATILDGGIAKITKILNDYEIENIEEFIQVKEISTKKH